MKLEDRFTKVAHTLLEALYVRSRPVYQIRIMLFLIRKTCGFHRTSYKASISDVALQVQMPRAAVALTIKQLLAEGLIVENGGAWSVRPPHEWRSLL